jgi:hypothetical protein
MTASRHDVKPETLSVSRLLPLKYPYKFIQDRCVGPPDPRLTNFKDVLFHGRRYTVKETG